MERKTINYFFIMVMLTLGFTSCYYDIAEDLYPTTTCVTDSMSYATNIVPIIKSNCIACHSTAANQGGVDIETYDKIKVYVENNSLLGSIKHQSGYSPMPKGGSKLSTCDISKIEAWITQGAKNN